VSTISGAGLGVTESLRESTTESRKGKLPALKVGSGWYVHVAKLAAQLDRQAEQAKIA
jgi:hypothetical protein